MQKNTCFSINSYIEIEDIIKSNQKNDKSLILFINNYLIKGFGVDWLKEFINKINKSYLAYNVKIYVDCGYDYGLAILVMSQKIHYLKLKSNKIILNKISQIAKKNKVLLNPNFDVVEISKLKNCKNINI